MNVGLIFILLVHSLYATSSARSLVPSVCSLKKVTGPCRASMRMYYYDQRLGTCLPFIYGGCRGNKNRFQTLEDCEKQCGKNCVRPCPMIYMPVCGTDGKTYGSQCMLDGATCQSSGKIKKDHDGECKKKCIRPCPMIYQPTCGSDGKTYSSMCELNVASCLTEETIEKVHDGACEPKCPKVCTMEYDPQCGSDGKTYGNPCELKIASCESNGRITFAHQGECDVCSMEKITGPCRAAFQRFYYNSVSKKCEKFIYGGCRGNGNNFEKLEDCQKKCM